MCRRQKLKQTFGGQWDKARSTDAILLQITPSIFEAVYAEISQTNIRNAELEI